jgi:hypothetical protein
MAQRNAQIERDDEIRHGADLEVDLSRLQKEGEELTELKDSTHRAYQECKAALKDKAENLFDKEFILKEHAKLISTLEQELKVVVGVIE